MRHPERRLNPSANETSSGSESQKSGSSEPEFLIVGQVIRPHGIRGEVGMKTLTAYPERLLHVETLYIGPGCEPIHVGRIRPHSEGMIIHFDGVDDRDAAEDLRGLLVHVHIDDAVPLAEGEVYLWQIEGIRVVTDAGQELGRVTGLFETGANDVYVVTTPEGGEVLLPAIPEVILKVNVEAQVMTVHLMNGLL
jgi:16S rRNA processing protein RimM